MNEDGPVTKSDLNQAVQQLKEYIDERTQQIREYTDERTHDAETRLLRAFSDYQHAETVGFRHMKAEIGNLNVATDER